MDGVVKGLLTSRAIVFRTWIAEWLVIHVLISHGHDPTTLREATKASKIARPSKLPEIARNKSSDRSGATLG